MIPGIHLRATIAALFAQVQQEQGRLDVLVNNAWGGSALPITGDPFREQPLDHWDNMFNAGVFCHVLSSRIGVRVMLGQRARPHRQHQLLGPR